MPRSGIDYHVDDNWRQRVRARLAELERRPSWLAVESGCPKSMISELLSGKRNNTTYARMTDAELEQWSDSAS